MDEHREEREELAALELEQRDDWRESDAVKQARAMLRDLGSPLWPGLTESDWTSVLRDVLAERDFIGEWLQRLLDEEHEVQQRLRDEECERQRTR